MLNVAKFVFMIFLFYVLSPNVLQRIPPNGSKHVVALVHAVVFSIVYYYTSSHVLFPKIIAFPQDVELKVSHLA